MLFRLQYLLVDAFSIFGSMSELQRWSNGKFLSGSGTGEEQRGSGMCESANDI